MGNYQKAIEILIACEDTILYAYCLYEIVNSSSCSEECLSDTEKEWIQEELFESLMGVSERLNLYNVIN